MADSRLLLAALDYAARGWPVLPLHNPIGKACSCGNPDCDRVGKHPRTKRGVLDASTDEQVIRSWWFSWPDANIGLACGHGRVVVDVDNPVALEEWEAVHGALPPTQKQHTGKGFHLVFSSGARVRNKVRFAPGMDIRADGGYIVGAPSLHVCGREYVWEIGADLDTPMAELPESILSLVAVPRVAESAPRERLDPALVLAGVEAGARNDTLYRYACRLYGHNKLTHAEVRPLVIAAARACKPPMRDDEVEVILGSAGKHIEVDVNEEPIPIETPPPPTFPLGALPEPLRQFAVEVAESVQIPFDVTAMLTIAAVAAMTSRRVRVRFPSHAVWTNLYLVVALPPGSRKSAAFEQIFGPIHDMEVEWQGKVQPEIVLRRDLRETEEKKILKIKDRAAAAKTDEERQEILERLTEARATMTPEIKLPVIAVSGDVTQEKLAVMLSEQGERLAMLDSEGTVFDMIAGRYTKGASSFDLLLKAWSGDPHRVDRMQRDPVILRSPLLTVALTTQPDVIVGLAERREFRGRGLLGRFCFCVPRSLVGTRLYQGLDVSSDAKLGYREALRQLFRATWADELVIPVENGALKAWAAFHDDIERRQSAGGDLEEIPDWGSKVAGTVAGLAGNFHCLRYRAPGEPINSKLCLEDMAAAIEIGEYLIGHAKAAFGMFNQDNRIKDAKRVLDWVKGVEGPSFSSKDVLRKFRGFRAEDLNVILELLIEHGFIRQVPSPKTGGRPAKRFSVVRLGVIQ